MADGSVSLGIAPVEKSPMNFLQRRKTRTQTPSANSKVKCMLMALELSNSAYSVSDDTLTYFPSNNGSYTLSVNDRIQFDYFY
jgi:hypothetical protein